MSLLEAAWEALREAEEEYKRYLKTEKPMRLRNACEKGWLAMVLATNHLLICAGAEKPQGRMERNKLLEELEKRVAEVKELGLTDRMWARASRLHAEGYYEGWIDKESLKMELEKVKRYLRDVERLTETISQRRDELKPILRKIQEKWKRS
jgi:hypothetical protein